MKTKLSLVISGIIMLLLAGCIPSIHPLYTSNDITFNPQLAGEWLEKDNSNRWKFESSGDSAYKLTYYESGVFGNDSTQTVSDFTVHLVKLKGYVFLDLYPGDNDHLQMSGMLSATLLPVHIFAKVVEENGEFSISFFSSEWLKQSILDKKIEIAHEIANEQIILTAPTKDLQEMVIQNADNAEAFVDPKILVKSKN